MELRLEKGDYIPDGRGGVVRVSGDDALLQRVLFRLTAHRGAFPFEETLGSRLWQLGRMPPSQQKSAAAQYVAEALSGEAGLSVESVELTPGKDGAAALTAVLDYRGEALTVTLEIRI